MKISLAIVRAVRLEPMFPDLFERPVYAELELYHDGSMDVSLYWSRPSGAPKLNGRFHFERNSEHGLRRLLNMPPARRPGPLSPINTLDHPHETEVEYG